MMRPSGQSLKFICESNSVEAYAVSRQWEDEFAWFSDRSRRKLIRPLMSEPPERANVPRSAYAEETEFMILTDSRAEKTTLLSGTHHTSDLYFPYHIKMRPMLPVHLPLPAGHRAIKRKLSFLVYHKFHFYGVTRRHSLRLPESVNRNSMVIIILIYRGYHNLIPAFGLNHFRYKTPFVFFGDDCNFTNFSGSHRFGLIRQQKRAVKNPETENQNSYND